jgi:N-acetylneuraminic acid mutarotase
MLKKFKSSNKFYSKKQNIMKKKLHKTISIAVVFIFNSIISFAQWSSISPVPAGIIGNDGAVSFTIGSKGYVVAGSATNNMYAYDTVTTSWSLVGTVPAGVGHAFAMGFALNGKGYVVGGDVSGTPQNTVWEFDPSLSVNQWSQKNNFPGGIRNAGFGFAVNGSGYIGAGNDNVYLYSDIWKYNQVGDSWTLLPVTLPINLIFPTSFVIGNKGYILTGGTDPSGVNEVTNMWCLDGSTDSLSAKANFTGVGRQAAFAFSNTLYGFVGGGQSNYATNYNDMWMYDPDNNHWSPAPNAPLFGAAWSSTFVIGNTAYAGLGAKFQGSGLTGNLNFYKFNMSIATGVTETNGEKILFIVYPNPAPESVQINASEKIENAVLTDAAGKIIYEAQNIKSDIFSMETKSFDNGIYFLRISSKQNTATQKLIVSH